MQVHGKLVGGNFGSSKRTKLAVLGGDWLLAQAVVRLAEIGNQQVVQMMSDGIKGFVISEKSDVILQQAMKSIDILKK
jgi:geranylgeranyl pyrophosphate synthase